MESITNGKAPNETEDDLAWNVAHDRLLNYFQTFYLGNHAKVSRLALEVLDRVRNRHTEAAECPPTKLCWDEAHRLFIEWLEENLEVGDRDRIQTFISGSLALALSHAFQRVPTAFLTSNLPENIRQNLRQTLLVTGPDLNISSMTPRHIDYGPMLGIAKQTWHRWNIQNLVITALFWMGVYGVLYYWLSDLL